MGPGPDPRATSRARSAPHRGVVVYSTVFCGYCRAAERLLRRQGVDFLRIDITFDRSTRQWLKDATGRSTVPQIFVDGESIGGFDELSQLAEHGELDRLVLSAPTED